MKNLEKLIFIFVIVIIIVLIALLVLLKRNSENENIELNEVNNNIISDTNSEYNTKNVDIENTTFINVKNSVDIFFNYANNSQTGILTLLDSDYLKKYNIDKENLSTWIGIGSELISISEEYFEDKKNEFLEIKNALNVSDTKFDYHIIKKIDVLSRNDNFETLKVTMLVKKGNNIGDYILIVNLDKKNNTFSIIPQAEYSEKKENSSITRLSNNILEEIDLNEMNICKILLNVYSNSLSNIEYSYSLLDENYKKLKFETVQKYYDYLISKKQQLEKMTLFKYVVEKSDKYTYYICVDQYDNNYIFKTNSLMNFSVLLDNYTILTELEEEQYNEMENEEKAEYNIDRFIEMLKRSDYNTAYKYLNEEFKKNYFRTSDDLKKYIETNIFYIANSNTDIEAVDEESTGVYAITVKITKEINTLHNYGDYTPVTKKFFIKLNEGTDFELSFNVE